MSHQPPLPHASYGQASPAPRCLYCSGDSFELLYSGIQDRLRHVPGEHTFWKCVSCGSALLVPQPQESELAAFYPEVYSPTPDRPNQGALKRFLAQLEFRLFFQPQNLGQTITLLNHIGHRPRSERQLLDIGCGLGYRLLEFRKRGWDVHGADLQPEVVEYLNKKLGIPAQTASFSNVASCYPSSHFDLVTSYFTFEHIPDVRGAFQACWQLLKPGGWLGIVVPLIDSAQGRLFGRRWIHVTEAPRRVSLPSQGGIEACCRGVGFQKVRTLHDHPLCVGANFALSLIPASNSTNLYSSTGLRPLLNRVLGAAFTLVGLGSAFLDRWQNAIPATGLIVAQKPEEATT